MLTAMWAIVRRHDSIVVDKVAPYIKVVKPEVNSVFAILVRFRLRTGCVCWDFVGVTCRG